MPPSFSKDLKAKAVEVVGQILPDYIKPAETQDQIMKSLQGLPSKPLGMPESEIVEGLKELQKSLLPNKNGELVPKSFLYNSLTYSDTQNLPNLIRGLTYGTMHTMVHQSQILSAIVNTRINQISAFARVPRTKHALGFRVQKKGKIKMSDAEKRKCTEYEEFILNCGVGSAAHKRDFFEQFIKKISRDRLIVDQVNFERVFTLGGKLHEIVAIDSATIRIALRKYLDTKQGFTVGIDSSVVWDPRSNNVSRYTVPDSERAYVQVMNGQIVREYTEDEMAFLVSWPRTEVNVAGYGYSEVEQLIQTITALLFASEYNRRFFSSGSSPKGVLNVKANMNQTQMDGFKKAWLAQLSGISGAWRTPIVAAEGGLEFINMQQTNREMEFAKYNDFLIKVACAVYQIAPEEINFSSQTSTSGQGTVFESKSELRLKASRDKGLVPLLTFFENGLNREVMRYIDPEYEIVFVGLDGGTEGDQIELHEKELKTFKTVNEVREQNDLEPLEGGDIILNSAFVQMESLKMNMKNQKETLKKTQDFQMDQMEVQNENQINAEKRQMEMQAQMPEEDEAPEEAEAPEKKPAKTSEKQEKKPKKKIKKSLDWEYGNFNNFEDFAEAIQSNIHTGNFEKSLNALEGPIQVLEGQ